MIPVLYESTETSFTTNGLGGLADAIEAKVKEQRNGVYELEMIYPVTGRHFDLLQLGRIICVTHDDTGDRQPFDIYKISRVLDGKVSVYARHISYRLNKIPVQPFTANSCTSALNGLATNAAVTCPFTFWTDKTVSATFTVGVPSSIRALLGGQQGSILDTFGTGEYEFDKFTVKFHLHRGANNGVTIRYGKNLTELNDETGNGETFTGVYPYWNGEGGTMVTLPEKVVYADPHDDRVVPLDLTEYFQTQPTENELRTRAQSYIDSHTAKLSKSIKISFVQLWQTNEFKGLASLQRVKLCDTVTVVHESLGVAATSEVVEVVWNVLAERYDSMTLSEVSTTLADVFSAQIDVETKNLAQKSWVSAAVAAGTQLLAGGYGGHVVIGTSADGYPEEILIMDTEDKATAVNVIRMNSAGIGFSSSGYNGPFDTAWTVDGHFYADWIDAGTLNANLIRAGEITDAYNQFYLNLETGQFRFNASGASMNGTQIATLSDTAAVSGEVAQLRDGEVLSNSQDIAGILQWISFDVSNGLQIGSADTGYSVRIKDSEIGFYNGSTKMAYISNQQLFIGDIQVQKSLQFGITTPEWAFVPRANGNLSFRYIGA